MNQPRLQDIAGFRPQYFNTSSIVSNVALITAPHTDPIAAAGATSTIGSTSLEQAAKSDSEIVERPIEGESHPPPAFNNTNHNAARSRVSQASGLSSIITLPSFIASDRPHHYSSSVGVPTESPVRLHHRKRSSLYEQRFGIDAVNPILPGNEEGGVGARPTPGASHTVPSQPKRKGATPPPVTSPSPPSRPPRRFPGRLNLVFGARDEAITEWRRLPPLPPAQPPQSLRVTGVEDLPAERPPSYYEEEPKPPAFLAWHVPLPPSPSTLASPGSSLSYATSSPAEIPPYTTYPPLPHSTPSTPRSFGHPPTPHSTDQFVDAHSTPPADPSTSLAINTRRRLSGDAGWTRSNFSTPTTARLSALPGSNDSLSYYSPVSDGTRRSAHRRSTISSFSQGSVVQEILLPSPPPSIFPPSPPPPLSPRGPRPLLTSGQLKRSGTFHTQASSTSR